jgi:transketolase
MAAIVNGIALHGCFRPFASTFLIFATYQMNSIRMAALQNLPVIHVFSHDSITVGEDGPTHQPIEVLAGLRAIPNLLVLRPGDAQETLECWELALNRQSGPTALILSRAPLPQQPRDFAEGNCSRGGYLLSSASGTEPAEINLSASGSEVSLAVAGKKLLEEKGIRASVISMPSQQLFFDQEVEYQDALLDPVIPRLIIEASHPLSLWQLAGPRGEVHGVAKFGASAPPAVILEQFGMTPEKIAERALNVVRG